MLSLEFKNKDMDILGVRYDKLDSGCIRVYISIEAGYNGDTSYIEISAKEFDQFAHYIQEYNETIQKEQEERDEKSNDSNS